MKTVCLFIFLIFPSLLFSQKTLMGFRYGYGMYNMKDLKSLQELRRSLTELPLETTENYPMAPFYRFEMGSVQNGILSKWALYYTFSSTGARSTLSDYSGEYNLDAIVNSNHLGIDFQHDFKTSYPFFISPYFDLGFVWSKLKTKDFLNLVFPGHSTYGTEYSFRSKGLSSELGLNINYTYKFLRTSLNVGYLFDFSGNFYMTEDKSNWLTMNDKKIGPQWNGLRMGLQLDVLISKKQKH